MKKVFINGNCYDIQLVVFDKDGLMFQSEPFWIALAQSRIDAMKAYYPEIWKSFGEKYLQLTGAESVWDKGMIRVKKLDPFGIFAVASVPEEITAMTAFLTEHMQISWLEARKAAEKIFNTAEDFFHLEDALKPRKGFPDILKRLRDATIPYGIATSDTKERAKKSVELFDDYSKVKFVVTIDDVERGKPDPDMLWWIQKRTKIPMENIAMVGDSIVDVEMAKNAGAIGIGIPEHEEMKQKMCGIASEIVDSLEDIKMEGR